MKRYQVEKAGAKLPVHPRSSRQPLPHPLSRRARGRPFAAPCASEPLRYGARSPNPPRGMIARRSVSGLYVLAHVNLTVPALFDRLVSLGAARELTGGRRSAFTGCDAMAGGLWCNSRTAEKLGARASLVRRQAPQSRSWRCLPVVLSLLNAN